MLVCYNVHPLAPCLRGPCIRANKSNKSSSSLRTTAKIFQTLRCLLVFVVVTAKNFNSGLLQYTPYPSERLTHSNRSC